MLRALPADFNFSILNDQTLETVEFGQWKLTLVFTNGVIIGVEDEVSVDEQQRQELPQALLQIYPLLNKNVKQLSIQDVATLVIEFDGHRKLYIHATEAPYESYQIERNGSVLAVV